MFGGATGVEVKSDVWLSSGLIKFIVGLSAVTFISETLIGWQKRTLSWGSSVLGEVLRDILGFESLDTEVELVGKDEVGVSVDLAGSVGTVGLVGLVELFELWNRWKSGLCGHDPYISDLLLIRYFLLR